jgi:hypothetical protein
VYDFNSAHNGVEMSISCSFEKSFLDMKKINLYIDSINGLINTKKNTVKNKYEYKKDR